METVDRGENSLSSIGTGLELVLHCAGSITPGRVFSPRVLCDHIYKMNRQVLHFTQCGAQRRHREGAAEISRVCVGGSVELSRDSRVMVEACASEGPCTAPSKGAGPSAVPECHGLPRETPGPHLQEGRRRDWDEYFLEGIKKAHIGREFESKGSRDQEAWGGPWKHLEGKF